MIFKPELIDKILAGQKTQTRRPVKPGDVGWGRHITAGEYLAVGHNGRRHWQVFRDYAVTPGRGKPAIIVHYDHPCYGIDMIEPGDEHYALAKSGVWEYQKQGYQQMRIRITRIRQEDAREISHADALAEGFQDAAGFLETWAGFYDPVMLRRISANYAERPAELYQCWALDFEVVRA